MSELIERDAEKLLNQIIEKGCICSAYLNKADNNALLYLVDQGIVKDFNQLGIKFMNECYMFTLADNSLGLVEQCDSYGHCKMVKTK